MFKTRKKIPSEDLTSVALCNLSVPHEAPASMELETVGGHLVLQVGAPVLGHAGHLAPQPVLVVQLHALVDEGAAHGDGGLQLSQLVLN